MIDAAGKVVSGFASDSNGLKFGFVGENATVFLHALETMGKTKVLASPRIFVLNKQPASIHIGDKLGYKNNVTTQTSTSQNVQFWMSAPNFRSSRSSIPTAIFAWRSTPTQHGPYRRRRRATNQHDGDDQQRDCSQRQDDCHRRSDR